MATVPLIIFKQKLYYFIIIMEQSILFTIKQLIIIILSLIIISPNPVKHLIKKKKLSYPILQVQLKKRQLKQI